MEPAGVQRELAGFDGHLLESPSNLSTMDLRSDRDVISLSYRSAGMGDMASQSIAGHKGPRAGVKTRAYRAWKASQQR